MLLRARHTGKGAITVVPLQNWGNIFTEQTLQKLLINVIWLLLYSCLHKKASNASKIQKSAFRIRNCTPDHLKFDEQ